MKQESDRNTRNRPDSFDKNTHFTLQSSGVAVVLLP